MMMNQQTHVILRKATMRNCPQFACIFLVDANITSSTPGGNNGNLTIVPMIHKALHWTWLEQQKLCLRTKYASTWYSYLNETLRLCRRDSGLSIRGFPGEDVWISGAIPLQQVEWNKHADTIHVANLTELLASTMMTLSKVAAVFYDPCSLIRAQ